jgi:membrane protein YqaA with SNARE-associated domain
MQEQRADAGPAGRRQLLVASWALAEATIWPVMPDAVLAPLAAARPGEWWRLAAAASAGSLAGGLLSYLAGRRLEVGSILARLPLVRWPMILAAERWLAEEGPAGLWHQPFSGLPFKVFALLAGQQRLPLGPFLGWALLARGARFVVVAGGAALLGARFRPLMTSQARLLLVLWSLLFLLGLWQTVRQWERRGAGADEAE